MKSGIDYFTLDCQLDEKFELIEAEFGLKGFAVIVKLLQRIYAMGGYYCEWTKEIELLFSSRIGLKCTDDGCNFVSQIVNASIKRGIFSRELFDKYHILTSHGIQVRYLKAAGRRIKVEMKKPYLLLKCEEISKNVDIIGENVYINDKNADILKQSKVKESKVKESRVNNNKKPVFDVDYIENIVGPLNGTSLQIVTSWLDDGMEFELIKKAVDISANNNVPKFNYMKSIVNSWISSNVKTVEKYNLWHKTNFQHKNSNQKYNGTFQEYDYDAIEKLAAKKLEEKFKKKEADKDE